MRAEAPYHEMNSIIWPKRSHSAFKQCLVFVIVYGQVRQEAYVECHYMLSYTCTICLSSVMAAEGSFSLLLHECLTKGVCVIVDEQVQQSGKRSKVVFSFPCSSK